jgi:hypothetical protein
MLFLLMIVGKTSNLKLEFGTKLKSSIIFKMGPYLNFNSLAYTHIERFLNLLLIVMVW